MHIQELDPEKFYAVIVESEYVTNEDLDCIKQGFTEKGLKVVVVGGDGPSAMVPRFWGIYSPVSKRWLQKIDGEVYYYPAPGIAQAHLETHLNVLPRMVDGRGNPIDEKLMVKAMTG